MSDDWSEVRLGDCYDLIAERQDSRALEPGSRYFGLEHLSPESPIASHGGTTSDVAGQVSAFQPGDTLFGRLRPYLRKVSFAGVGGYCSPEILVLRPRTEIAVPRFLHLLASSEGIIAQAIASSAGSRMPRTAAADLAAISIALPPLAVQRRIVDLMAHVDTHLASLRAEREAITRVAETVMAAQLAGGLGDDVTQVRLADVWSESSHPERVLQDVAYRIAGVLNQGKGLIDKGELLGQSTQYARLFRLRPGQVVMRRLTAWEGPIAVVPAAFDGWCVSNEFPTFDIDETLMTVGFADALCQWPGLWHQMRQRVTGSVMRRKRLSPEQLLSVEVPLPALDRQRVIGDAVGRARSIVTLLDHEIDALATSRASLLASLLNGEIAIPDAYQLLYSEAA